MTLDINTSPRLTTHMDIINENFYTKTKQNLVENNTDNLFLQVNKEKPVNLQEQKLQNCEVK